MSGQTERDVADIWTVEERFETPVTARARVKRVGSLLTQAELDLQRDRDAEVDAELVYEKAVREAQLSPSAPTVERGGSTVADKKAWVDERCSEAQFRYRIAKLKRETSKAHYDRLDTQGMFAMAILKSIDRAMSGGRGD